MLRGEEYDGNGVYDAAGAASCQLVAPREDPEAELGHHYQSPYRRRCIDRLRRPFGQALLALRGRVERSYGNLTAFGGGLSPLPAWVRRLGRVRIWVWAKLLINGVRIMERQGLTA